MKALVYDRIRAVPLNIDDLNRIEEWSAYLSDYLNSLGYAVFIRVKTWDEHSIPWQHEIDRLRKNIQKLYKGFHYFPEWRDIVFTNSLDFEQVNIMEWDLNMIYTWLLRLSEFFWHSGSFYCDEGGIL